MKIRTTDNGPMPCPLAFLRWSAVDDDTYEAGEPIGYGATEAEAINDLKDQCEPEEGDWINWPETLDEVYKVEG